MLGVWLRDVSFGAPGEAPEARENARSPVQVKSVGKRGACAFDYEFGKRRFSASVGADQNKIQAGPGPLRAYLHAFDRRFTYSRPVRHADEVPAPAPPIKLSSPCRFWESSLHSDHRMT
jgi:hypothetical protein